MPEERPATAVRGAGRPPSGGRAAVLVAGLAVTMALGTLLGFAYGVLAPFLVDDLGLSSFQIGVLPSVMYAVGALAARASGDLTDRWGAHRATIGVAPLVAAAFAVFAVANGYPVLLASAVVGGVALSVTNPATNRVVAERLAGPSQGWAMGWKQAGVSGSAVLAGAVLPSVASAAGWEAAALTAAALTVVLGLAFSRVLRGGEGHAPREDGPDRTPPAPVGGAVRDLATYAGSMGATNGAVGAYLVLFATEDAGLTPAAAGGLTVVVGATAVVARIAWARLGARPGRAAPLLRGIAVAAVVFLGALPLGASVAPALLWPAAVGLGASAVSWQGLVMLTVLSRVPPAQVGQASGIVVRSFYAGYVAGPLAFGAILEWVAGAYATAWAMLAVLAALSTAVVRSATWERHAHQPGAATP